MTAQSTWASDVARKGYGAAARAVPCALSVSLCSSARLSSTASIVVPLSLGCDLRGRPRKLLDMRTRPPPSNEKRDVDPTLAPSSRMARKPWLARLERTPGPSIPAAGGGANQRLPASVRSSMGCDASRIGEKRTRLP